MRIISGNSKGRSLKAVPGMSTRPTTDKVKEAIFSMIGPYFTAGKVLDLFAGSGGLGIEALSRGMDLAIFVDLEKKAIDTVRNNLLAANLSEQGEVYRNDALRALNALSKRDIQFDLVFLDPPYRLKLIPKIILQLGQRNLLSPVATIVVEHDAEDELPVDINGSTLTRRVDYGDTAVTLYQFQKELQSGSQSESKIEG